MSLLLPAEALSKAILGAAIKSAPSVGPGKKKPLVLSVVPPSMQRLTHADLAAAVEKDLGRALGPEELQVVREVEDPPSFFHLAAWSHLRVADLVTSIARDRIITSRLEALASSPGSLAEDRQRLVASFPEAKAALDGWDWPAAFETFSGWFLGLVRREPPPGTTRALKFGLAGTENMDDCRALYACGTNDDYALVQADGWAEISDWWPAGRDAPFQQLSWLEEPLREAGAEPWAVVQGIVIAFAKGFFTLYASDFAAACGLDRVHVLSGYDDGRLYAVRTVVSPPP